MESRYIATFILHAVGDTIGFKNGEWEFNYHSKINTLNTTLEIVYEFISLGGINDIDLSGWNVSDDTLFHLGIGHSLIDEQNTTSEKFFTTVREYFIGIYNQIVDDEAIHKVRYIGEMTSKSIKEFPKNRDSRTLPYNKRSGGNGAAMRTACIGLAYYGEENRDKLIELSIQSSRLTHNSPIGYLGGLVTALFTSYAIEGIKLTEWPYKLLELLETEKIKKFIREEYEEEQEDYEKYISYWRKYVDGKFDDGVPIKTRSSKNLIYRSRYFYENFTKDEAGGIWMGDSGFSSVITAYDCLLESNGNWEPLIIYSALNWGDSDSIACIAGAWFGALYGFKNIPESNLKHLEFKDEIEYIAKEIYKIYYKNDKDDDKTKIKKKENNEIVINKK